MKNDKVAKPGRKPIASGRPRPKLRNAQSRKDGGLHEAKSPSPTQSRSTAMRLAAEVDALAAQLEASRARASASSKRGSTSTR